MTRPAGYPARNADGSCQWCPFLTTCLIYSRCPHRPADDVIDEPGLFSVDWTGADE